MTGPGGFDDVLALGSVFAFFAGMQENCYVNRQIHKLQGFEGFGAGLTRPAKPAGDR
jgi:hypothetical protein